MISDLTTVAVKLIVLNAAIMGNVALMILTVWCVRMVLRR